MWVPDYGAVGVISYGGGKGHVGFAVGRQGNGILLLDGNQSDQVKVSPFSRFKFAAFTFPSGYDVPSSPLDLTEHKGKALEELPFGQPWQ